MGADGSSIAFQLSKYKETFLNNLKRLHNDSKMSRWVRIFFWNHYKQNYIKKYQELPEDKWIWKLLTAAGT